MISAADKKQVEARLWHIFGSQGTLVGWGGWGEKTWIRASRLDEQELTSSWLTVYLGSYFDRRYHCEREDKLS